jgi:hypothetical protein
MEFSCESVYILGPVAFPCSLCNRLHKASSAAFRRPCEFHPQPPKIPMLGNLVHNGLIRLTFGQVISPGHSHYDTQFFSHVFVSIAPERICRTLTPNSCSPVWASKSPSVLTLTRPT